MKQTGHHNSFFSYLTLGLGGLLLFVFFSESHISIPTWLQPIGRMHPLLLHFPIVLFILLMIAELFKKSLSLGVYQKIVPPLALANALLSVIVALMGLFLAQETEYSSEGVLWHKWSGMSLALLGVLLFYTAERQMTSSAFLKLHRLGLLIAFPILILGSHQGAQITHGKDFLWEPLQKNNPELVLTQNVYIDHIEPILVKKCIKCHSKVKTKGDLNMESHAELMQGGESGPVLIAGDPKESDLMRRILLPESDEERMPPEGKIPLTKKESELIEAWIRLGAHGDLVFQDLADTSELRRVIEEGRQIGVTNIYNFKPVKPKVLEKINGPFLSARPIHLNSPALEVDLFVRKTYTPDLLNQLKQIREQTVHLNLTNMPITDDDLDFISSFPNLETLLLNATDITGDNLGVFKDHGSLKSLSLTSTPITRQDILSLDGSASLRSLYLWNTSITEEELDELKRQMPTVEFYDGFRSDSEPLVQLNPPQIKNKLEILNLDEAIELSHQLNGVQIVYSIDGADPTDSSDIYDDPLKIRQFTTLKTFARKEGWLPSNVVTHSFFVKGKDFEVALLEKPNQQYSGQGASALVDLDKGKINKFGSGKWLGFKEESFSALVDLGQNYEPATEVVLSYGLNIGSYIMPPTHVEVFGGNTTNNMRRLFRKRMPTPTNDEPNDEVALSLELPKQQFRYLKINAYPIQKLPKWHAGAGSKGWLFVDELFVY